MHRLPQRHALQSGAPRLASRVEGSRRPRMATRIACCALLWAPAVAAAGPRIEPAEERASSTRASSLPGGPRLRIEGLTVLDADALIARWQPVLDRSADEAASIAIARAIQAEVRAAGRPFARVVLPARHPSEGELRIVVVEGRYGRVDLRGGAADQAQAWFDDLKPGRPIGDELERQVQAVSRLPGVTIHAGLGPGAQAGEGDVDLTVEQARRWALDLRADNHGNPYAGRWRGSVAGHAHGLLFLGDRLSASAGGNSGKGWEGAAAYQLPWGRRGTRISLSASHHRYQLGGEFTRLGAQGQVDAAGLTVLVPLTTRGPGQLTWQIGAEARRLRNEQAAVALSDRRQAAAMTTGLQAVLHPSADTAAWGGVWMEIGDLRIREASAAAIDAASVRAAGQYLVLSVDAAWLRQWRAWGLLLRGSGQVADRNLDASRKFSLGGARSVRAWPLGETSGDHGVLGQVELRHRWRSLEPFGFLDAGRVRFNHTPWLSGDAARTARVGRTLAGAGVGMRWRHGPWSAEGTAGWRLGTAAQRRSTSDPKGRLPQVWVSVSYSL